MNYEKLTIKQMAEINGLKSSTLRYYERAGLLCPDSVNPQNGYRYYNLKQSALLDFIRYLQSYGMSLAEIKAYLESTSIMPLKKYLQAIHRRFGEEFKAALRIYRLLERAIELYNRIEAMPKDGSVFKEYACRRCIFKYQSEENIVALDDIRKELVMRALRRKMAEYNLPPAYLSDAGIRVRKGAVVAGEFHSNEVFVFMEDDYDGPGEKEVIPAGTYLVLCSEKPLREPGQLEPIREFARKNDLALADECICEVIFERPIMDGNKRGMVYKIQVPIK